MSTTIIHLRCTTSCAAGNGLGAAMKYLRHTTSAAANNGLSTTITPPLVVQRLLKNNSEPHTGARPSVRLCVGPELARCVHINKLRVFAGEGRLEELFDRKARPVLLPSMMAMTSLATVVALGWLAGASTKLTAAATCVASRILSHGHGFGAFTHAKRALGSKVNGVQRV